MFFSQLIEALVAAFKCCTLSQRTGNDLPPTPTTANIVTTTTTTFSFDTDASTDVDRQSTDNSSGISGTSTQYGDDAPVIKVKLEKAKVCVTFYCSTLYTFQYV
jgi:hypothetical protein